MRISRFFACSVFVVSACLLMVSCSEDKKEKSTCFSLIMEVPFDDSMGKSETEFKFVFANSDDVARYTKAKLCMRRTFLLRLQRVIQ